MDSYNVNFFFPDEIVGPRRYFKTFTQLIRLTQTFLQHTFEFLMNLKIPGVVRACFDSKPGGYDPFHLSCDVNNQESLKRFLSESVRSLLEQNTLCLT
ncbi:hypothetical protein EUGRSUZ_C02423 [Eucalyptus grandis]|uniref:Uncharacterized protein n=2 Tax=Eucalyptus grandis TaxID=71139 RepID=A0ACC3LFI4_EUCGR|nr:hypothetical protein EUGRSUZ_C02423 [Eucalyptus grandis]